MRVLAQIERSAAENFALAAGLLRAHLIEGVPLPRLAADYGFSLPRLRATLADHLAACTKALEMIEPPTLPTPETAPEASLATVSIRVRERIRHPV